MSSRKSAAPQRKTAGTDSAGRQPRVGAADPQSESAEGVLEDRHSRIARLAYYKAEKRGFAPGGELQDWLEAEQEIDDRGVRH